MECTRISSVVNVTLLIVLCVPKTLALTDRHSDSTGDINDSIDVKQCKLTINATVGALQRSEGPDCSRTKGHKGYRNCADNPSWACIGQCMDCYGNGTCLDYTSMTQHLGNQSPCTTEAEKIMCCTLLHMLPDDQCRNGGKLFCEGGEGDTYAPKCTCLVGWTGETCKDRMHETVTCKCFKTDIMLNSFYGENYMYKCTDDGRPENWPQCRQTIEGVTFSRCACENSEVHHSTTTLQECYKEGISVLNDNQALNQSNITSSTPSVSSNGAAMVSRSAAIAFTFSLILI